jgi:ABC-type Fe3+-hydroxamate transport system substrate-binding protein
LFPVLLLPGQRPIERAFHADPVRSVCSSRLTPRSAQQAIWRTSSDTISVTDDEGITLSFGSPPGRIVSLLPAATEILFALAIVSSGGPASILIRRKCSTFPASVTASGHRWR